MAKAQCENIRTALCYQDNCGSVAPLLSYFWKQIFILSGETTFTKPANEIQIFFGFFKGRLTMS